MTKPARFTAYVYDGKNHTSDTPCHYKWSWCRIHWWPQFTPNGQKWYEPYVLTVNRRTEDGWVTVKVYCGPGTFYPKPANNGSYSK